MTGKFHPLDKYYEIAKKFDAILYIDDAHGFGVIGEGGRGIANHFNLNWENLLYVGSLSKALSSLGGFIAGNKEIIDYIKMTAPTFIFSGPLPLPNLAAALAAIDILDSAEGKQSLEKLWHNTKNVSQMLEKIGYQTNKGMTPIVSVYLGKIEKAVALTKACYEKGIFVNITANPAVPKNKNGIRISVNSVHDENDLKLLENVFSSLYRTVI